MMWHWALAVLLVATQPARADDLVSTTQVVAGIMTGALPASVLGNVSVITQSGFGNVAVTNQTGIGDVARVSQSGNNFSASILQSGQNDSATVTQTGNGIGAPPIIITQTGPAQAITITQHR